MSDVGIEQIARPTATAVVRRKASLHDLPRVVPELCGVVWKVIKAHQVTGAGRHLALYLDDEMNIEVGVELETPFAVHGEVGEVVSSSLPAGRVATAVHRGPYPRLGQTHQMIRDWCAAHGEKMAGPNWEIYDHWRDEWNQNPSLIRTDVYYLLA